MMLTALLNLFALAFLDLVLDLLYWPIWWYSRGLLNMAKFCGREIAEQQEKLGLMIWVKNIFTPMYGQYDIEGRIISFFVRLSQIIVRLVLLMVWGFFVFLMLVIWLILPVFIIYEIYQFLR